MNVLTKEDLRFVVTRLPKDIYKLMGDMPIFLAGGFIRETVAGGEVKDIDLFVPSLEKARELETAIKQKRTESRTHQSDNAITILSHPRLPIQIITRWMFSEPEQLVSSFDFTVCQAAIWKKNGTWSSMIADDFYSDLAARRLVYTFPNREEEAGGSMMRVKKFLKRGYNIQPDSLSGVIARLTKGIAYTDEQERAAGIKQRLREVDPLLMIDGVDLIDEHQLINNQ